MPAEKSEREGRLHIGPAGWSYKDWIGPVYPPGKRIDQLVTIASQFDCVELNSSFYRTPGSSTVAGWARRTAAIPDFTFTIKVLQRFTHERTCDPDEARYFIDTFRPIMEQGRLGAFLLQFPWSFRNSAENRRYLELLGGLFGRHPTAVELRHGSWNEPSTLQLLSNCGLAFCNIDQPVIGDSIPPTEFVTDTRLGYIRLHGRNRKAWFNREADRDERYNYLYGENEIGQWSERAQRILRKVEHLFIITNNHFKGQALVNAYQLKSLLEKRKLHIPESLRSAYPVLNTIGEPW